MTKLELAEMLERFIGDTPGCGEWEWDDFTSVRATPELEPFRQQLLQQGDGMFDLPAIREIIAELKGAREQHAL
ncbi:hypothetical protein [Sphingomonas psychrotolerans]|uniref:Uncharacterized protein n=1 Tax=Sphingomonas psychrotolerans TaxID=1327635 RepID=A0A2K8MI80_9SPHN|nr:hypothetical protein [Sphingomonas psychrotolerans]ATY33598.1 hypothetical protein CVN68_17870 [Sphingomonas psychrotolerans]